jgi:hypothetical protein
MLEVNRVAKKATTQFKDVVVKSPRTAWHPPFVQAMKGTFVDHLDDLSIEPEHKLTSEPLSIDLIIVKKVNNVVIKNEIAKIFRAVNIFEYKNPSDSFNVFDFHKTIAYCRLYISQEKISIGAVTLSIVVSKMSDAMKRELQSAGCTVSEEVKGITLVEGEKHPIQVIETTKLPSESNLLLKGLNKDMSPDDMTSIMELGELISTKVDLKAYLEVVIGANPDALEGVLRKMPLTSGLKKVLEEVGYAKEWEERAELRGIQLGEQIGEKKGRYEGRNEGRNEGLVIGAKAMVELGIPLATIATKYNQPVSVIESWVR